MDEYNRILSMFCNPHVVILATIPASVPDLRAFPRSPLQAPKGPCSSCECVGTLRSQGRVATMRGER